MNAAPIVSKPLTVNFIVASSHKTEKAAVTAARRNGALFILYQAENRSYAAVWHVCQGQANSRW